MIVMPFLKGQVKWLLINVLVAFNIALIGYTVLGFKIYGAVKEVDREINNFKQEAHQIDREWQETQRSIRAEWERQQRSR